MTKTDVVKFWVDSSKQDFQVATDNLKLKHYNYALFFCHLALEKALKAQVVRATNKAAPPVHDLRRLAKAANIPVPDDLNEQLKQISTFNVEARYDDYKLKFYQKATPEFTTKWFTITKDLLQWLYKK